MKRRLIDLNVANMDARNKHEERNFPLRWHLLPVTLLATSLTLLPAPAQPAASSAQVWLTNRDRTQLLALQPEKLAFHPAGESPASIQIDDQQTYQTVDGFGFALTGASGQLLHHMDPASRHALLQKIFGKGPEDASVSYIRLSIGASDMNDHVFTYDDIPVGQTDVSLQHFSLAEDETDLVPVLREILAISPKLQILATPWTAPAWMKTKEAAKDGHLKPEFYTVYADYLVRYLKAMQSHGVPIASITVQNEPLNSNNTPSMVMEAPEENVFIRDAFGPALKRARLKTRIVVFDHNCDRPDYPIAILNDAKTSSFVDGSGFHLYAGEISAMSEVHRAFPAKNLYFTEQMVIEEVHDGKPQTIADPVSRVVIGATRNWSRNVLLWNLAADPGFGPHTSDGGCPVCQGAITIDGNRTTMNIAFHTIAQVSRFVPPGSVHIASTQPETTLANAAWRTPAGKHVLVVANTNAAATTFTVTIAGAAFNASLEPGSVATYVW